MGGGVVKFRANLHATRDEFVRAGMEVVPVLGTGTSRSSRPKAM